MARIVFDAQAGWERPHRALADLRRARDAGVTAFCTTLVGAGGGELFDWARTLEGAALYRAVVDATPDLALLVREPDDIRRAAETGRVGVLLDLQEAAFLAEDVSRVSALWLAGVRMVQLTYNAQTAIGAGCVEGDAGSGLTRRGRQVVAALDDHGILVDVAHVGRRTTLDAIAASRSPVVASHAGARAVFDSPRSKTDEEIRALAARGGVIAIYAVPAFLGPGADVGAVADHVCHVLDLVGPAHVALGTDRPIVPDPPTLDRDAYLAEMGAVLDAFPPELFAGFPEALWPPALPGLSATCEWPALAGELTRRGCDDATLDGLLGLNLLRVYDAVHAARADDLEATALDVCTARSCAP